MKNFCIMIFNLWWAASWQCQQLKFVKMIYEHISLHCCFYDTDQHNGNFVILIFKLYFSTHGVAVYTQIMEWAQACKKGVYLTFVTWYCCNLSGGVALIVWFTTNRMCGKNNTIICVARASNSKRDCEHDLYCCLLPQCEALRTCRSGYPIATVLWKSMLSSYFCATL